MENLFKYMYVSCHTYDYIVGIVRAATPEDARKKVMDAVTKDLMIGLDMSNAKHEQFFKDRMDELNLTIDPVTFENDMIEVCAYPYRY